MLERFQHTQITPVEGYETLLKCYVRENPSLTLWRRHDGPMVDVMDPYWGSLHCVCTLIVPLLTQMYKWVPVTE